MPARRNFCRWNLIRENTTLRKDPVGSDVHRLLAKFEFTSCGLFKRQSQLDDRHSPRPSLRLCAQPRHAWSSRASTPSGDRRTMPSALLSFMVRHMRLVLVGVTFTARSICPAQVHNAGGEYLTDRDPWAGGRRRKSTPSGETTNERYPPHRGGVWGSLTRWHCR